jgi:hypothetical protein
MGIKYAIIQYDKENDEYYAVTSPKFNERKPLTSLKGYIYFLQTDLLKIHPFNLSEQGSIYKKLASHYHQPDIYFKTYRIGNMVVALALKKDTYNAMVKLQVKKAYSLPFLIVTTFERLLKAPVVYYDRTSDGTSYIYFDGEIIKVFTLYDDFKTFIKPIVDTQEVFYIRVLAKATKKDSTNENLLIEDKGDNNELDFSYVDVTLQEISKKMKLAYDVFEQNIQTEKVNIPKSVTWLIALSAIAIILYVSIQPLANVLQPIVMPYKPISGNIQVPSIDSLAFQPQNNISDFVYKKGTNYTLYAVEINGKEVTFPTLAEFKKYKDQLKIKYPNAKFYKLIYKNNQLSDKVEMP